MVQRRPPHSTAVFATPTVGGRTPIYRPAAPRSTPAESAWLAMAACVFGCTSSNGPHSDRPQSCAPSRAQIAWASANVDRARALSEAVGGGGAPCARTTAAPARKAHADSSSGTAVRPAPPLEAETVPDVM